MRRPAVLLCHPMGHEYLQYHRACRQLAVRLCAAGFPVLRFDFYACGDSMGESEAGEIGQWLLDVDTAANELQRRSGSASICLVGLRLGGALAVLHGLRRGGTDRMVLWDPVFRGRAYLDEISAMHAAMLRSAHVIQKKWKGQGMREILGFPMTDTLHKELLKVDVSAIEQKPASDVLLIESNERASQVPLKKHLERLGVRFRYQRTPTPQFWVWAEDFGGLLVPRPILESIVSWLSEVGS